MAWTVQNALRDHLAGAGSLQAALSGGSLRFFDAGANLLSSHQIGTVATVNNVLTVPFQSGAVGAGVAGADAATAQILNSASAVILSSNNVGVDIPFPGDGHLDWNEDDVIKPGNATLTLTATIVT